MLNDMSFCSAECGTEDCERHKANAPKLRFVLLRWTDLADQCPRYSPVAPDDGDLSEFKQETIDGF